MNAFELALEVPQYACDECGIAIPLVDIGPRRALVPGEQVEIRPPRCERAGWPEYRDCCDTPMYCSSVRRCTRMDSAA